jgi:hypothetical protein
MHDKKDDVHLRSLCLKTGVGFRERKAPAIACCLLNDKKDGHVVSSLGLETGSLRTVWMSSSVAGICFQGVQAVQAPSQ